jgi:hypothetical protein
MIQSPTDDDVLVFLGKFAHECVTPSFRNAWNKLGDGRLRRKYQGLERGKIRAGIHVPSNLTQLGPCCQLDELRRVPIRALQNLQRDLRHQELG